MQITPTAAVTPGAPATTLPAPVPFKVPPREVVHYEGSGLYSTFSASITGPRIGRAAGYDNAGKAIGAMVMLTKGPEQTAVAVVKEGNRYVGRQLRVDFEHDDDLKQIHGKWRLEQNPYDNQWNGDWHPDGDTTCDPNLVAIVDGKEIITKSQFELPPD